MSKPEFVPPPAKTPLNPHQLAKRRFFNPSHEEHENEQGEHPMQDQLEGDLRANEDGLIRRRR